MLQNPFGWIHEHSKEKILSYATSIFEDIRKYGDVKLWWEKTEDFYRGHDYGDDLYEVKQGAQHFWKRVPFVDLTGVEKHKDNFIEIDNETPNAKRTRFNDDANKNKPSAYLNKPVDFDEVVEDGNEDEDITSISWNTNHNKNQNNDNMSMDLSDNIDQEIHDILEIARNESDSQWM